MKTQILGMLAETFIHPGAGQSVGAIDLPVAREAATSYPFIAGSSLKGAMRDAFEQKDAGNAENIFGKQENAGNLLVSDARLLLLPVRSLSSSYKWLTCPHLLERLQRDMARGQHALNLNVSVGEKKALSVEKQGKLFLEERSFEIVGQVDKPIIDAIKSLFGKSPAAERLEKQLTVISDKDFSHFARYGLAIQARNALDNKTKITKPGALWYEETIPPDTLMYSVLIERNGDALSQVQEKINDYLQVGGNETVGQGWFALNWQESKA